MIRVTLRRDVPKRYRVVRRSIRWLEKRPSNTHPMALLKN
jgi:hypothetical protein